MAASKSYCARANYRFLSSDQSLSNDPMIFELDESDVWNAAARSQSPEIRKASNSRLSRKSSSAAAEAGGNGRVGGGPSSLPVNVPDWSKILKDEYMKNRRRESDDDYDEDDGEESGDRIPPHEFLARQMARTRISSFSVHEGIGEDSQGERSQQGEKRDLAENWFRGLIQF